MKKVLNPDTIVNELKGNSSYFKEARSSENSQTLYETEKPKTDDTVIPRQHDTTTPSNRDTILTIRKKVKEIGKEAATHRLTAQEKQKLRDLIYQFTQKGIKTSENEIARIAIHYLIANFEAAGENSVLTQVLHELYS